MNLKTYLRIKQGAWYNPWSWGKKDNDSSSKSEPKQAIYGDDLYKDYNLPFYYPYSPRSEDEYTYGDGGVGAGVPGYGYFADPTEDYYRTPYLPDPRDPKRINTLPYERGGRWNWTWDGREDEIPISDMINAYHVVTTPGGTPIKARNGNYTKIYGPIQKDSDDYIYELNHTKGYRNLKELYEQDKDSYDKLREKNLFDKVIKKKQEVHDKPKEKKQEVHNKPSGKKQELDDFPF